MPARKPPTERQRRLGAELRKLREQVGMSHVEAARTHGTDRTTVSNIESGRFGVSPDRVRVWAANYHCPDRAYVDALVSMARESRVTNWWDEYRGITAAQLLDLAEMEHYAARLRSVQITHIPGLLQHEDYVRAVFDVAVPPLSPEDLERKLNFRLRRSEVLDRTDPPECTFLIHEGALRMQFGTRRTSKAQFEHLLKQSDRENVAIRVIPFSAGGFPHAGSSTQYAHGPVPQLDVAQFDTPTGAAFLHSETHLANYRAVLDRTEQRALDAGQSRDFIHEVARQL